MQIRQHIPNALTLFRLLTSPLILFFYIYLSTYHAFGWFILLVGTDILDGRLSRAWNCTSEFGRKMDSYADAAVYTLMYGVIFHKVWEDLLHLLPYIIPVILLWVVVPIIGKILSGVGGALHLSSRRFSGIFVNITVISILFVGVNDLIILATLTLFFLSTLEEIAIYIVAGKNINHDYHSIIPYLKERKS